MMTLERLKETCIKSALYPAWGEGSPGPGMDDGILWVRGRVGGGAYFNILLSMAVCLIWMSRLVGSIWFGGTYL